MYERKSAPAPPCSSGTQTPSSPSSPSLSSSARGNAVRAVPLRGVRLDLRVREVAGDRLDLPLLRCKLEVHRRQTTRMRFVAISLAVLALTACGGKAASPESVARAWSAALNSNDNDAAAKLFAPGAQIVQAGVLTLRTRRDAVRWNASLPCGGRIASVQPQADNEVLVIFHLDRASGPPMRRSRRRRGGALHRRPRQDRHLARDGRADEQRGVRPNSRT